MGPAQAHPQAGVSESDKTMPSGPEGPREPSVEHLLESSGSYLKREALPAIIDNLPTHLNLLSPPCGQGETGRLGSQKDFPAPYE
jgi:hypothetical protein